ncbi:LOW QUALITY PROTEIN: RNA-binding motif protein, X-linked 2-like [Microcebus murinus]|uniref:LOW QUALITY PROTEIN: RNA-binding motif protein, X-linked 2-like n=1 Tax=Microcebus murinus TaxID=30608 RepID=UPI003F6BA546
MNPLTKAKLTSKLNEREVRLGVPDKVSWHSEYKDSAWIFLGGLPYELTEGDIICVFSQYGEIVNINLVRDKKTGKSKGFCFLCYEDQRSTILAVDNFNGIKIKGRTIRLDHVSTYRAPKDSEELEDVTRELQDKGCGARTPSPSFLRALKMTNPLKEEEEKERTDRAVQAEQPSSSSPRSKAIKEKDGPGPKKHSSKNSERVEKPESKEGRSASASPEARTTWHGGAEDLEREPEEKPKHEHKSSSRKEAREEKNRDRDRGRSSDTHSGWNRRSEHQLNWYF